MRTEAKRYKHQHQKDGREAGYREFRAIGADLRSNEYMALPFFIQPYLLTPQLQCDGQRPACANCSRLGNTCFYDAAKGETRITARAREHEALIQERDDLQSQLEAAYGELRALRAEQATGQALEATSSGPQYATETGYGPPGPLDDRVSLLTANRAALPDAISTLEFELMLSYSNAYVLNSLPDFDTLKALHGKRIRTAFDGIALTTR